VVVATRFKWCKEMDVCRCRQAVTIVGSCRPVAIETVEECVMLMNSFH
jgi:hypothetical protein